MAGFFNGWKRSDGPGHFSGAQASGADIDGTDGTVVVDLYLFHIRFPGFICASADLATVDADSMAGLAGFFRRFHTLPSVVTPPSFLFHDITNVF